MAKKTSKKKTTKKTTRKASGRSSKASGGGAGGKKASSRRGPGRGLGTKKGDAEGKHLVIVESPSKAKTINKYLGKDYLVLASVGHVRDLPAKAPKGVKQPVPGVDLEKRFTPSYQVLDGKEAVVKDLQRAAKETLSTGGEIWFATDLDREGEAIAWHLAQLLNIPSTEAKRVIFPEITKASIGKAFDNPHSIDEDKVNAQQARRILDRIVGYQVSPLLWKKVARGLSAGRVQSVAVRLVVEREREIRAFIPDEYWRVEGLFSLSKSDAERLGPAWRELLGQRDDKNQPPTQKAQNAWLGQEGAIRAELIEVAGAKFDISSKGSDADGNELGVQDLTDRVKSVAELVGLTDIEAETREDDRGKGPGTFVRTVRGVADPSTPYKIKNIETRRTKSRPAPPLITSTLQQAASSRLGFAARRTMSTAQSLYEGVDVPGEGPTGLITYMRTDSTNLAPEAVNTCRDHIRRTYGDTYLPEKAIFYKTKSTQAQEAHEAIRPTDVSRTPQSIKKALKPDQLKLYELIWQRFVACQMVPAEWDATTALIEGGTDAKQPCTFRASGRVLAFDGFYKVTGVPSAGEDAQLPRLDTDQSLSPFAFDPQQKFTSPPSRYSEASLIKILEAEGIGRPSTYASIIQVIQDRSYVEQIGRAFYATDLGEVVTDKLVEAFPKIMDVSYTRAMEAELDKVEDEHLDWIEMLQRFYGPFAENLERAHEELQHAKAEVVPAPDEYRCETCGSTLVYRFGKNGRFLSCSTYPECKYACPCDREGRPRKAEFVNVKCPRTGRPMVRRTGRFGPFLTTHLEDGEDQSKGLILNIDKKGKVQAPSIPPLVTDLPCPIDEAPLNLRSGVRGPWLGCSNFPKCRGRGKWAELDDDKKQSLERQLDEHEKANPTPTITTLDGKRLTDEKGKPLADAPAVEQLLIDDPAEIDGGDRGNGRASSERDVGVPV
ncbi:MAG: DNA topoisomerase [Planctomycetota bacterium]